MTSWKLFITYRILHLNGVINTLDELSDPVAAQLYDEFQQTVF